MFTVSLKTRLLVPLLALITISACTFSKSSQSQSLKPPYYGVFVEQNGELIELQEREFLRSPIESEARDATTIYDPQPTIIVWRNDTNLDYLNFYKLNQYLGQSRNDVEYRALPKDDGVIEISPSNPLVDGVYCLVQGNPLAVTLPGWCFRIGSASQIQPSPIPAIETKQTAMWELCFSYEDSNQPENAIQCWEDVTLSEPQSFFNCDNLQRVYANQSNFQRALSASLRCLELATAPDEKAEAYLRIGLSYYSLGDYNNAIINLKEAIQIEQPSSGHKANALIWLARTYEANGQQAEACQAFKNALEFAEGENYEWGINAANAGLAKCP